ncbi:MAG: DMT family transporter [Oceanococcus sp.]|nr:MAG: DMT family transporter [Oceanococcus sp.]
MTVHWRALVALALGAIGIGFAPICVRMIELEPVASAFWRLALAAPALWLVSAWMARGPDRPKAPRDRRALLLAVAAGLAFAGDLGVWHYSIVFTSVANATLLANLAPVFIALWSISVLGLRLGGQYWLGLVLALVGAAVLVGVNFGQGEALLGDTLGVLTAAFYAAYQLFIAGARRHYGTWELMWISTAVSALCLLPFVLAAGHGWPQSSHDWLRLLALAGISHILGQGLIAYALAHLASAFAAVGLLVQPVAAAGFAWLLLAETVSPLQAAGGAVVLFGIVVCRRANVGTADRSTRHAAQ